MEEAYLLFLITGATWSLLLCGACWIWIRRDLRRRIDEGIAKRFGERLDGQSDAPSELLAGLLDRHVAECPLRQESLLASCFPSDAEQKGERSFHRTFQSSYPGFLPELRKRAPGITPMEETLCMLIKMKLSNREIADKMSVSVKSLHTFRYRLKQKILPEGVEEMDKWLQAIE